MRFKIGDLAIFVVAAYPDAAKYIGKVGEIIDTRCLCPCGCGLVTDYNFAVPELRACIFCMDYQLRKIDAQPEPKSLTRTTDQPVEESA